MYIDCKVKTAHNISINLSPPDTHSLSSILYLLARACVCTCILARPLLTQAPRIGGASTAWPGPKASVLQRLLAVARSTGETTEITAGPTNVTATRLGVGRVS